MPNTKTPTVQKPEPVYSIKGKAAVNQCLNTLREVLKTEKLGEGGYLVYFFRSIKAEALASTGDIKPKDKCKKCRGRGYVMRAVPKKQGKYEDEDFKKSPCECIIGQVNLMTEAELREIHKEVLKEVEDEKAKSANGTNPEATQQPTKRRTRVKKSEDKPEEQAEVKPPVKRRVKKSSEPGETA